jgi:hypothetical protein
VRTAFVGLALSLILTPVAAAVELTPLKALLDGQPEETYRHVRCAAFYLANIEWGGQALNEAAFEESKSAVSALLLVATLERASKVDGSIEHWAQTVNADVRAIADLYATNYRQSYATRGSAWAGNTLWNSDAETCKPIAEVALMMRAELEKGDEQ